ncbi:hypothetical protein FLAVO9R_10084 [Flavobacterium sp. 9R]|nr:hypothetical protein FLAVO9R_10084 [Flavobacterium sp. 9R]
MPLLVFIFFTIIKAIDKLINHITVFLTPTKVIFHYIIAQ